MITTFDGYKKRDGNNSNVLLDGGETKPKWLLDNRVIVSDTETGDKLSSSTGSFTFLGNNLIDDLYDWVGLQVASNNDKGLLVWDNGSLMVRQNDGSSWTNWARVITDKNYHIPMTYTLIKNTKSALYWRKLGTFTTAGSPYSLIIDIFSGAGYNGYPSLNTWCRIMIKDGWQSTPSINNCLGITCELFGYLLSSDYDDQNSSVTESNRIKITVKVTDRPNNNSASGELWVLLPWLYANGHYVVSGIYNNWTHNTAAVTDSESNKTDTPTHNLNSVAYYSNVPHIDVGRNNLTEYAGSFFFGGRNSLFSGEDYVGLLAGNSADKWQLIAGQGSLWWRQNDNGGINTSWGNLKQLIDTSNISDYAITSLSNLVTNSNPSLKWNTTHTIGSVGGTNLQFTFGDNEGTSDFTDGTELLSSYASNDGFAINNSSYKNVIYRRKASSMYNYIKGKLDSVYQPKGNYLTSHLSLTNYVKLDPGANEQTIKSNIGTLQKGVINLWRNSGNHYTFLGFSNGTTETYLGGIGFTAQGNTCPYYLNTSGTAYPLYHSNNLPTRTFITGYTNNDKVGWWCPFATIEFKNRYKSQSATLCFLKYYTNDSNSNHRGGFLFINVQQLTSLGNAPYISLYTIGLNPEFVKAITTLSSTSNKIDFYIKLDKMYQYYYISKINGDDIINIRDLILTLPSGTLYDCKDTIKANTGISLSYDSDGTMTITNSSPNLATSLYLGASSGTTNAALSTNGNTYLILKDGSDYIRKQIKGYDGISVTNTTTELKIGLPSLSSYALSSSLSNYVLKTGDTMSGNLIMFSNSNSIENAIKVKTKRNISSGTEWAFAPLTIIGNDDTRIAQFGVLGNKQNFTYLYIGSNDWDSLNNFRIYSDHIQSSYLDIDRSGYGSLPQGVQLSVIRARMCNSGTGTYSFQDIISVFGSGETGSSVNNLPVRIGSPSGATVVSAGESGNSFISAEPTIGSTENLYLTSDGLIDLYTNCNTIANRKHVQIDTSGNIAIKHSGGGIDTWYITEGYTYKLAFGVGSGNTNRGIYQFKASTSGSGTYPNGKWLLYFNASDNATFTSDVIAANFYSNSDIRLKNVINNPIYKAEDFANLDLVKYTWKNNEDKVHLGSIAQSAEKEFPELVNTNQDGYKSLDYSVLGVVGVISLAKEIIELKEEIKELKSKLYG